MATPSDENLSPEEKLLKVIQQGKPGPQPSPPRKASATEWSPSASAAKRAAPAAPDAAPGAGAPSRGTAGIAEPAQAVAATASVPAFKSPPATGHAKAESAHAHTSATAEPPRPAPGTVKGVAAPKPAAPVPAAEKKLALQAKAAEPKAEPKAEPVPRAIAEAPATGGRQGSRQGGVTPLRIVNRGIAAAAAVLFVAVVLELTAAKPVLPKPPENTGSPVVFPGAIVPPHDEASYIDPTLRNVWVMGAAERSGTIGPALPPKFEQVMRYVAENIRLEGIGPGDGEDGFAAITEKGATRYLRKGAVLTVAVDGGTEKITLDRITRNEAIFTCGDRQIAIKGTK
ncbi:MAG: hypothetical protein WCL44_09160 [bacterium]